MSRFQDLPLIYKFSSEHELLETIKELSQLFTSKRNVEKYFETPRFVAAYAYFYLPTNQEKILFLLNQIDPKIKETILHGQILDFGCGPGTFYAGIEALFHGSYLGVDKSELMLEQARKLYKDKKNVTFTSNPKTLKAQTIIFGQVLNEMTDEEIQSTLSKLECEYIIILEPGTKDAFAKTLVARKFLIEAGFSALYPCPNNEACPMENTTNWCHQLLYTHFSAEIERVCQLVKLDRLKLPMVAHLYSKEKKETAACRLLRVIEETKFSFELEVCENNQIKHLSAFKKYMDAKMKRTFKRLSWGGALDYEVMDQKKDKTIIKIREVVTSD